MIHAQNFKLVSITPPGAIYDNASPTTASIDTSGWDYLTVIVQLGATDIAMTALKMQESDTDGSFADVTGLIYGTSNGINGSASTLPSATDDNKFFVFEVDLRGRKKFMKLVATAGDGTAGTYFVAQGLLSRGKDFPVTAAERGVANILRLPAA
jgi:hypothetical protein